MTALGLDFGTTNSCYGWKRRRAGPEGLERPPACSAEIPSAIRFMSSCLGTRVSANIPRVPSGCRKPVCTQFGLDGQGASVPFPTPRECLGPPQQPAIRATPKSSPIVCTS